MEPTPEEVKQIQILYEAAYLLDIDVILHRHLRNFWKDRLAAKKRPKVGDVAEVMSLILKGNLD